MPSPAVMSEPRTSGAPSPGASGRVLVADDQPDVLRAAQLLLKTHGYAVTGVASPSAVLAAIARGTGGGFDLLLMDLNYARDTTSGEEGLELLSRVRELAPDLPVVVMTGWSTVPLAVALMREGAGDFVEKPWDNRRLLAAVQAQITAGRGRRRAQRMEADAREVQRKLLVRSLPHLGGYDVGVAWDFAEPLGGDAYAVAALPRGRLGVAIADGCGKGTPAALLMASVQATLEDLMAAALAPGEVCARLGQALRPRMGTERFVSLAYAVLDRESMTLAYCNAGHPPPLLLRRGAVQRLQRGGPVLGPVADGSYEEAVLRVEPGDRLVLFTDGILEAGPDGPGGEELGEPRVIEHLDGVRSARAQEAAASLLGRARDFARGRLADDATVVVVDFARLLPVS